MKCCEYATRVLFSLLQNALAYCENSLGNRTCKWTFRFQPKAGARDYQN